MTADELIKNIEGVIEDFTQGEMAVSLLRAAESARSLIMDRVTERGVNAKGEPFKGYSTTPMLANCSTFTQNACNKIAGSKEKRKDLHWVTLNRMNKKGKKIRLFELPGGYSQLRELEGRQTDHVDFSMTGMMWKSIQVTSGMAEAKEGYAVIRPNNSEDMDKLVGNEDRRGEILALSEEELDMITDDILDGAIEVLRNNNII